MWESSPAATADLTNPHIPTGAEELQLSSERFARCNLRAAGIRQYSTRASEIRDEVKHRKRTHRNMIPPLVVYKYSRVGDRHNAYCLYTPQV